MRLALNWGWRISLQMALIVAPLMGLLVFKLVAESRSADVLARVYPQQLVAADAHLAYQGFVDGFNEATYSGALSERAVQALQGAQAALHRLAATGVPEAQALVARLEALDAKLAGKASVEPLLGEKAEIAALSKGIQDTRLRFQQAAAQTMAQARRDIGRQALAVSVLAVFVLTMAALMVRSLVQGLTTPLKHGVHLANQIAAGDLRVPVAVPAGNDETARLLQALTLMAGKLEQLVGRVKTSASSVALSTREVASGNIDLSNRTERAAQSIQEMLQGVEKLSHGAAAASKGAQQGSLVAGEARKAAVQAGQVVEELRGMLERQAQSSREMLEITSVIDGIASQTNILAFNAASTASRSGDQGRVYTTVAKEIRSLAHRCAVAAKEISSLLKANVESIEASGRKIVAASSVMGTIIEQAQSLDGMVGAISNAAVTQSRDIEQVRGRLASLEGMTQQNAALVEEIAATSEALEMQTTELADTVGYFVVA